MARWEPVFLVGPGVTPEPSPHFNREGLRFPRRRDKAQPLGSSCSEIGLVASQKRLGSVAGRRRTAVAPCLRTALHVPMLSPQAASMCGAEGPPEGHRRSWGASHAPHPRVGLDPTQRPQGMQQPCGWAGQRLVCPGHPKLLSPGGRGQGCAPCRTRVG